MIRMGCSIRHKLVNLTPKECIYIYEKEKLIHQELLKQKSVYSRYRVKSNEALLLQIFISFILFQKYLLVSSSSEKGASLDPKRRENLIQV